MKTDRTPPVGGSGQARAQCCEGTGDHTISCTHDRVLPALGEIQLRSGDVLVWDGSGWVRWTGARQEAMRVLAEHHETTGMRVSMGHTCRCGVLIRYGSIATHQVEALVAAGVITKEDDRG